MLVLLSLIIYESVVALVRSSQSANPSSKVQATARCVSVWCVIIMSMVHFPLQLPAVSLVFNVLAGTMVRERVGQRGTSMAGLTSKRRTRYVAALCLVLISSLCLWYGIKVKLALRIWGASCQAFNRGDYIIGTALYEKVCVVYPNAKALANCAAFVLQKGDKRRAIELFQESAMLCPDPDVIERIGVAYLDMATGERFPITISEVKAVGMRYHRLPVMLTKELCIERAVAYMELARNIRPWRLTSKYYLACCYAVCGNRSAEVITLKSIVNTPLKLRTESAVRMKTDAVKRLIALGDGKRDVFEEVFDLDDRHTWNESKW